MTNGGEVSSLRSPSTRGETWAAVGLLLVTILGAFFGLYGQYAALRQQVVDNEQTLVQQQRTLDLIETRLDALELARGK